MQPDEAYALYHEGTRIIRHERLRRAARTRRAAQSQYSGTSADRITTHGVSRYSPDEGGWLLVVVMIAMLFCVAMVVGAAAAAFCRTVGF